MTTINKPKITMDTIKQCAPTIRQYMNPQSLAPYLIAYSLLTTDESFHFLHENKSSGESSDYLIKILEAKHPDSGQIFYQCLKLETEHLGHSQIIAELERCALQGTSTKRTAEIYHISEPKSACSEPKPKFSLEDLKKMYKKVIKEGFMQLRHDELSEQQKEIIGEVQAMLIVVNDSEFMATMSYLKPPQNEKILKIHRNVKIGLDNNNPIIFYIGMFGKCLVAVTRVEQGRGKVALYHCDFFKNVLLIAAIGVAAGFPENGVKLGDVVVSQQIIDCSIYKDQDGEYIPRGSTTHAFEYLVKRLKDNKFQWEFVCASQDTKSSVMFGRFLSKPMLLNNEAERKKILKYFGKEAKGYEMEGFSIAEGGISCIIIKGICDFACGKDKTWQPTAALAANDCLYHDLNEMDLSLMKEKAGDGDWGKGGKKQGAFMVKPTITVSATKETAVNRRDDDKDDKAEPNGGKNKQPTDSMYSQPNVWKYTEEDIKKATESFSESRKLGGGGFGDVYQGCINGTNVAVKKLTENTAAAEAGMNIPEKFSSGGQLNCEVWALQRCRHKNLVELVGYCSQPPILIYEYMEGGDLHDLMFKKKTPLDWSQRSNILKDICCGLTWLHGTNPPIIHGDVKMSNILLDKHLSAKLGDFGFAKQISKIVGNRSFMTTKLMAKTLGYNPPEMDEGKVSPKSDVYSYGVLVLELFTGLEAYSKERADPKLTAHLEDELKTPEGYRNIADKVPGNLDQHSLDLFAKIIEGCLKRYGKRFKSNQVMELWKEMKF